MNSRIELLSDLVVNQIAAGEVVERPASVVRELVENALDAEASLIRVELERAGRRRIRVSDDGFGISAEDLPKSFVRHATSKIRSADDLEQIGSLGFRGEALSSIAAVSSFSLSSRDRSSAVRTCISTLGGQESSRSEEGGSIGTTVDVKNLFFNVPARKKFLKTERHETSLIRRWLTLTAFAWPAVGFELILDGKQDFFLPGEQTFRERSNARFGDQFSIFHYSEGDISFDACLSHPSKAVRDRKSLGVLINGRVVNEPTITRAVIDGFGGLLRDRYVPKGVLSLRVVPEFVDVNVHPQKTEVRFQDASILYSVVRRGVGKFIGESLSGEIQAVSEGHPNEGQESSSAEASRTFSAGTAASSVSDSPVRENTSSPEAPQQALFQRVGESDSSGISEDALSAIRDARYVGIIFGCFLLFESEGAFWILDMHAAHERINYNRIRSAVERGEVLGSSRLLFPTILPVRAESQDFLNSHLELFRELGFSLEPFSEGELIIHEVPDYLEHGMVAETVEELLLLAESQAVRSAVSTLKDRICSELACRASIKSGDTITREEVYALVEQICEAEQGMACPHGRPVLTQFGRGEVEQWFARRSYG